MSNRRTKNRTGNQEVNEEWGCGKVNLTKREVHISQMFDESFPHVERRVESK